ncbi:MAG TPA: GDYXXLXY domain-containing protein [Pseudomonadales bacterium]|nr:GDYXXLXY domain-containing protein [Pseudomonadales bacterium]
MKLKLFILVLVLQAAWLLTTVATQEYALVRGRAILLETRIIDPRDILRGDYLLLNYKISDVPDKLFSPPVPNGLAAGTKIFVALAPGTNGFYEVTRASASEFVPEQSEILMKGKIDNNWWRATNTVHVAYGIENYYVAEDTGNPHGKLTVQVIVPASGHPKIKQVFLDGRPYADAMKP